MANGDVSLPSVGRIVHYQAHTGPAQPCADCRGEGFFDGEGTVCERCEGRGVVVDRVGVVRAAIVTETAQEHPALGDPLTVALCVLHPAGMSFLQGVRHHADAVPGTWHWPRRA